MTMNDSWKDRLANWYHDSREWVRDHPPVIVLFLCLIVVGGFGWYSYSNREEKVVVDEETLCPVNPQQIRDYALILLDGTDDIVGEYEEALYREVRSIARTLPRYGKISLHDVATGKDRLLMKCAPKSPDKHDLLNENLRRIKNAYEKNYLDKVDAAVRAFLEDESRDQSQSPLLYRIFDVTELSDFQETDNRSFHIFSDMLENSDGYSHYRLTTPKEFGRLSGQNQYEKPQLDGVEVSIFYLLRNKSRIYQSDNHRLFWDNYFNAAGAQLVKWKDINLPGEEQSRPSPVISAHPPNPKPVPKPKSNPVLQPMPITCNLSAKDQYRRDIVHREKNPEALYCLAKLCADGSIVDKESDEVLDMMNNKAFVGDDVATEFREFVGEMHLYGLCGFKQDYTDSYVLLSCAGEKGTGRLLALQKGLHDAGRSVATEAKLNDMQTNNLCH